MLLSLLAAGCDRSRQQAEGPQPSDPEDYGTLSGLKGSADQRLRDELARITEEYGTPALLSKTTVEAADNVAAGLKGLFSEKQVRSILSEAESVFPPKKFELNPIRLQKAIRMRTRYDGQRGRARKALERPQCEFGIRFTAGLAADMTFVDVVKICAHLEAFQAAEALSKGNLDEAIEALRYMLRLTMCLGAEKHLQTRLEAAYLRTKSFVVLQAIVEDDNTVEEHLRELYELVQDHLKSWPTDADAWVGDRAVGLHAYEVVRAGSLSELLSPEEARLFDAEADMAEIAVAAQRNVDADELYYLEAMRKMIDGCSQPYYQRVALLDATIEDLQHRRNSPDFPLVAVHVLLPNIKEAHAVQAQDRANWEAWAVALALANRGEPPHQINPLTGERYRQTSLDDLIVVSNFGSGEQGDDPSIVVPLRAPADSGRSP